MVKTYVTSLLALVLAFSSVGCGGNFTPVVHAQQPTAPNTPVGPDSISCGPTDDGDACTFLTHVLDDKGNVVLYCQGETHYFPLTKTYSFSLEIGINQLVADPNKSGCNVPMPSSMTILNMRGANTLIPFTKNQTTIVDWIYGLSAGHKASLYNGTLTAMQGNPVAVALQGDAGQNLQFANGGHPTDSFLVWFDIDLPGSTPATIKVSASGDTE